MSWDSSIDNGIVDKLLDEFVLPHVRDKIYSIKVAEVVACYLVYPYDNKTFDKLIINVTFHEGVLPYNYVDLIDSINTVIKLLGQCPAYYGIRYKRMV